MNTQTQIWDHQICKTYQNITTTLVIITTVIIIIIVIELTHSKNILEITVETEPQPAAVDFKNIS